MANLLEVKDLKQHFRVSRHFTVKAVDGISFDIEEGETYGLVGESGSGKSTTGRAIIRLYNPTAGEVVFDGHTISGKLSEKELAYVRRNIQMVFQDPMSSLNPRKTVLEIVAEGLDNVEKLPEDERRRRVVEVLEKVGLDEAFLSRYPHQFSGGQRQRIGIARALITRPKLIIADEAISALDVSIQAQVVNLFKRVQKEMGVTLLFIAHDLSMVRYISDKIGVMHLGHLVEKGTTEEIFLHPVHPYTKALLSAAPTPNPLIERNREAIAYDRERAGIDYTAGTYHLVDGTHEILATDEEFARWTSGDYEGVFHEA